MTETWRDGGDVERWRTEDGGKKDITQIGGSSASSSQPDKRGGKKQAKECPPEPRNGRPLAPLL